MIPPLAPTFDAALRDVRADKPNFRIAAAHRLADPPDERREEALGGLLALCDDETGAVREAAFEAIGELGAASALERLVSGFGDAHRGARQAAVLAAGRVAGEQARETIEGLLEDDRAEMRFSAIWTLSAVHLVRPSSLASALSDPDAEVRQLALECMADLDASAHLEPVADRLEDDSELVRFAAARTLATLGDNRGASLLREALRDNERAFDAAVALGDLADRDSLSDLAAVAKARFKSPILRVAAARALVLLGDPLGAETIRKTVRGWRIEARQYAVQLVGELGLSSLVPDVERSLKRAAPAEYPAYVACLERLAPNDPQARALLASLRPSDHPG